MPTGRAPATALTSSEPIISPVWSPDGSKLAYVSFEKKKPVIYVHSLATGQRQVVANFKGSNSAPAWSPDGRKLAVVLSKDGNSQIYSVNADGTGVQRLTQSAGIDTEPRYSPDGGSIYFTSDRGGSPQIYRMSANGGDAQRVTFEGSYNVSPRPSPDGKSLAFISRRDGRFQLAVMDLASKQVQILTDSHKDESPSFAPNSRMILIATEIGGRGVLSAVSSDGRIKQRLSIAGRRRPRAGLGPLHSIIFNGEHHEKTSYPRPAGRPDRRLQLDPGPTKPPARRSNHAAAPASTPVTAGGLDARGLPRELTDPKSVLSQRSIYFDLDKYDVKAEYKDLVAAHAKYLVANKGFKVLIQGNTDERGSREYNLSLGQKRSDAVKRSLIAARRQGRPGRIGQPRRGKAEEPGPRRSRLGRKPPRRHPLPRT